MLHLGDGEQMVLELPRRVHALYEAYCDIRLAPVSAPPVDDGPRRCRGFSRLIGRDELPVVAAPKSHDRRRILFAVYGVLFVRYNIATFLSAFFGSSATLCADGGGCISGTWQGLIFAAYPLGMALTSLVASQLVSRLGTRRAITFGLVIDLRLHR